MEQAFIYKKLFEFDFPNKPFLMSGELQIVTGHFERVEESQEKMAAQIDMLEDSIKEIKTAIIGNPSMGNRGLAEQVKDIEDRLKEYDRKGVIAIVDKVHAIDEKTKTYDLLLAKVTGASWMGRGVWIVMGLGGGWIIKTLLAKAGINI